MNKIEKKTCPVCDVNFVGKTICCTRNCYSKYHYHSNKDKRKEYYQLNRESILERCKVYYQNNKERIAEYQRIYSIGKTEPLIKELHNKIMDLEKEIEGLKSSPKKDKPKKERKDKRTDEERRQYYRDRYKKNKERYDEVMHAYRERKREFAIGKDPEKNYETFEKILKKKESRKLLAKLTGKEDDGPPPISKKDEEKIQKFLNSLKNKDEGSI